MEMPSLGAVFVLIDSSIISKVVDSAGRFRTYLHVLSCYCKYLPDTLLENRGVFVFIDLCKYVICARPVEWLKLYFFAICVIR